MDEVTLELIRSINENINLLVQERNRLTQLLDETLPSSRTVWSFLPDAVKTQLKSYIRSNFVLAYNGIGTVITTFDSLPATTTGESIG